MHYVKESNLVESIINGATNGAKMVVGIATLLIAFLGLVELVNLILGFVGTNINGLLDINFDWTLKSLLGYIFFPITFILGIPLNDTLEISKIIGERIVLTEVVSYQDLADLLKDGTIQNQRSVVIAVYALCGFAHVASMAIFVGGTIALVPNRKSDIANLGIKALFTSTLACLITSCIAGLFYNENYLNILNF